MRPRVRLVSRSCAIARALALAPAARERATGDTQSSATSLAASAAKAPARRAPKAGDAPRDSAVIDFLANAEDCTFGHRGVLLDLGDPTTRARMSGARLARRTSRSASTRARRGSASARARSSSSFVSSSELKSDDPISPARTLRRADSGLFIHFRARMNNAAETMYR